MFNTISQQKATKRKQRKPLVCVSARCELKSKAGFVRSKSGLKRLYGAARLVAWRPAPQIVTLAKKREAHKHMYWCVVVGVSCNGRNKSIILSAAGGINLRKPKRCGDGGSGDLES